MYSQEDVYLRPRVQPACGLHGGSDAGQEAKPGETPRSRNSIPRGCVIGVKCLALWIAFLLPFFQPQAAAQSDGGLKGTVSLKDTGDRLHQALVEIVELDLSTFTGDDGSFEFERVPAGTYQVISHLDSLFTEDVRAVTIEPGQVATVDFLLGLARRRDEVTVTAKEEEETTFESFQSVESLDSYDLAESTNVSLGEVLDHKVGTGIAKRSFGPGSSRPIIRGFDGDRVLMMEDGIRTGALSSQSGDHGELINPSSMERLEIVKGPATLLYSGNAMGGTVNAVSRHHQLHRHPHEGLRGFVSASAGTANALGGANAGFEYGAGRWMFWGQSGGVRTGDYTAAGQGVIYNSRSRMINGGGGVGRYGEKFFISVEAKYDDGSYGVPFAQEFHGHGHGEEEEDHHDEEEGEENEDHDEEESEDEDHGEEEEHEEEEIDRVGLDSQRRSYRLNWGLRNLDGVIDNFVSKVGYTDWSHDEIEFLEDGDSTVGTEFDQRQFVYRGVAEQREFGPLSGRFGFWGLARDYTVSGEEALSPPVKQKGFALFVLEELDFETVKFQFGARVETQRYTPAYPERGEAEEHHGEEEEEEEEEEIADAVNRAFTGASASAGVHVDLWRDGAFVANYSRSYRAPALEELYNYGPHAGNLAFEIGNPSLAAETGNGVEVSLRQGGGQIRSRLNFFHYGFDNFIFPFAPGHAEDGLQVIEYTQRNARFLGAEAGVELQLNPALWLDLGMDVVDAQDTDTGTPLPRIPPLRAKVGLDFNFGRFRVNPELILARRQDQTFTGETPTDGYGVVNLTASYTIPRQHFTHQFSVNVFNLGDRLYRNHSSFIKDLAPEIGRSVRFAYMVRFF